MAVRKLSFVRFCTDVLHLELTAAWRVLLKVAIDGVQLRELEGEERELARALFGEVETIDPRVRRVLVWRLGRAAGKSTIAAALAVYSAFTVDLSRAGRGQIPCAFVVSPSKPTAKIAVTIARELVRETDLERFVRDDTNEGFTLERPDRRIVEIRCVAASKGGANVRGRDVVVLVLDESEFFASENDTYAVTDRDQIAAVMPRLLGFVLCISTPWPTENFTAESFERNFGHPQDALAAIGTSMLMRPSEQLAQDIARESARDPESAAREYECKAGGRGGSRLFDPGAVDACVVPGRPLVVPAPYGAAIGCGGDLAMERDSSAIAVVGNTAGVYELLEVDELRPTRETPLVPAFVIERFAEIMKRHSARSIAMDAHYRQSAIEHLSPRGLRLIDAPPGAQGKYDTHLHARSIVHAGRLRIPPMPRLVAQFKAITATPLPGGGTRISSPRRAGGAHGDLVSALVLALFECRDFSGRAARLDASLFMPIRTRSADYGNLFGSSRAPPPPRAPQPNATLVPRAPGEQPTVVRLPAAPTYQPSGRGWGNGWGGGVF